MKITGYRSSYIKNKQNGQLYITTICDFNGDGLYDYLLGDGQAYGNGRVYVLYNNKENNIPNIDDIDSYLENNPTKGFWIASTNQKYFGVNGGGCIGDVNNDGLDDFSISSYYWNGATNVNYTIYAIYGQRNFNLPYIESIEQYINISTGFSVSSLMLASMSNFGDINGDGINDLGFDASGFSNNNLDLSGAYYFLYGTLSHVIKNIENLDQYLTNNNKIGFKIYGGQAGMQLGWDAGVAYDLNGDSINDIILSAPLTNESKGSAYIIYGKKGETFTDITSIDAYIKNSQKNGFIISGSSSNDLFGTGSSTIGDINGDGINDLVFGAYGASYSGLESGATYILFGQRTTFPNIDSIELYLQQNPWAGLKIYGSSAYDRMGPVNDIGDINGDGINDIQISAYNSSYAAIMSGAAYIIFGKKYNISNIASVETYIINKANGFKIYGSHNNEQLGGDVGELWGANNNLLLGSAIGKATILYRDSSNYGMFSELSDFHTMNATNTNGIMYLGKDGYWCKGQSIYIGDFNGDSKSDLLCNVNGQNYLMMSQSTIWNGTFTSVNSDPNGTISIGSNSTWCLTGSGLQQLLIGDFNNDGKSDLLCRNIGLSQDAGIIYVMLSNGTNFNPMGTNPDGLVNVGDFGTFCQVPGKLVVGNFTGFGGDSILCNDPIQGSFLMLPNGTNFISYNQKDPIGKVAMGFNEVWCTDSTDRLLAADFNGDGLKDLICNNQAGYNKIMLSALSNDGTSFLPIQYNNSHQNNGYIPMGGAGMQPHWCSSSGKLVTGHINADAYADLICNDAGNNMVMLCTPDGLGGYEFLAIDNNNPSGNGTIAMNDYPQWCLSGNIFTGNFRGLEPGGFPISDIWCNQGGEVV